MKASTSPFQQLFVTVLACWFCFLLTLLPNVGRAQFTNLFGTSNLEYFVRVIPDAQGFYVLGLENGTTATVTRIDQTGAWIWTHKMAFTSAWFDGIINPSTGNLLVVGSTLPLGTSNKSLIGEFTPNGYLCAKTLDEPGLEILSRITDNHDGTFSAIGLQTTVSTLQDVVIYNLSPNCTVNFKKYFFSPVNDNFANDILTLPSTDFLVAGSVGSQAIIYQMTAAGAFVGGAQGPAQYQYDDLANAGNDILAAANSTSGGQPRIIRFDASLFPIWEVSVSGLSTVERLEYAPNGYIYAVGTATVGNQSRAVVIKIDDCGGTCAPTMVWPGVAKYFDNGETSYTGGSIGLTPSGDFAFVDGRDGNPNAFGNTDCFLACTDGDLNSSCTEETMAGIFPATTLFDGPLEIELLFYDVPVEEVVEGPMMEYDTAGACGDLNDFPGFHCGQAVVTCFSGFNSPANYFSGVNQNAPVVALIDVRDQSAALPGTWWTQASATEYSHPLWTPQNIGQVFGIAIDKNDDVFVAASSIYTCETFAPNPYNYSPFTTAGGPGAIYRLDNVTGVPTVYISTGAFTPGGSTLPNNGSALGDIGYDKVHDQFFVTNHADGMIYRIKNGMVMSRFDPFTSVNPPATGQGSDPDFVDFGDRTWGVAYSPIHNRVYFATWKEDIGRPSFTVSNEIWSIGLDAFGEFAGTTYIGNGTWEDGEQLEITIPDIITGGCHYSNPVSDIAFSDSGRMLLAERTMASDCGGAFTQNWYGYAHYSHLLEYEYSGSWVVTPGHQLGPCIGNVGLKFQVGETGNQGSNSAGGCDYGYDSFDPSVTSQPDCDKFVWVTGDNLHPPTTTNTYCNQSGTTWLYGMQGIPATGGTMYNSYHVDFDNNVCSHDKILMGDVEVFKCGCNMPNPDFPCDSLWVTKDSVIFDPGVPGADTCCWDIDFHINAGPVAYLEVESITSGVIFNNPSLSSSFNWDSSSPPTGTLLTIVSSAPGHGVPQGTYNDALNFCLGNILTPAQDTQCVVFRWYVLGPTDIPYLACTDTCYFYCPPPVFGDTCLLVKNDSVYCDPAKPLEYFYFFQVQNLSDFTANQVILSNPTPGFSFKPCPPPSISATSPTIALPNPPLNPGIEPDSCSPTLCVKIVANAPVTSPTTVCFDTGLSSSDSCCHSPIEHCIVLEPCCDPCEERGYTVHQLPPADSCCHSLDITNGCNFNYFTKLELQLITSGVCFGSHWTGGPTPGDWFNPISTPNAIQWQHISGSVPKGTIPNLLNFCISKIDMVSEIPQTVLLNWYTIGSNGQDSIACTDTLVFDCDIQEFDCLLVLEDSINCAKDADGNLYYQYTMTFKNTSQPQHFATELIFNQIGGPPLVVFPNPVNFYPPGANWGDITTITTDFYPLSTVSPGDKLIFTLSLNDKFHPDDWCCFESDTLCVFVPECDTCICQPNLTLSQSGVEYPVFCDPHVGFIPTLPCPPDDVLIGGFMGCVDATTGELCDETEVIWELAGPDTTFGGTTTNFTQFIFPKEVVDEPGLYCLTLWTICDGAFCPTMPDTCVCKVTWVREECDTCCTTLEDFCEKLDNNVHLSVDEALCKATLNIGDIGCPFLIDSINWGPQTVIGPFFPGDMPMFTYPGSGVYTVCYHAIELDSTGNVCFEKEVCETIDLNCTDSCTCLGFQDMNFLINGDFLFVDCNNQPPLMLPCPDSTGNFFFHGNLLCSDSCATGVDWEFFDSGNISLWSGTAAVHGFGGNVFHFDLPNIPYSIFNGPGTFQLVLTGHCGADSCECVINFTLPPCDSLCPGNLVQNGMFEQGTPSGFDETIALATNWSGIWPGGGANSTADFYHTSMVLPAGLLSPLPGTQSNFGAMWCSSNPNDPIWREGMMNQLSTPIAQNSGCYDLEFKLACLGFYSGTPSLSVYGVPVGAVTTGNPGPSVPTNPNLFTQQAVLLATYAIPITCGQTFQKLTFNFDSGILPAAGIDRIFITRTDGVSGQVFIAIDDVCLVEAPCPDTCCTDLEDFLTAAANVQHNAQIGNCTISANGTGLDDCMEITWDWGDGSPTEGPYPNNTPVSHNYTGTPPPPYTVCYTVTEYNSVTGDSCWSAVFCVDEEVFCDTCATPPSNMVAWWPMEDQSGDLTGVDIVGSHHGTPKPGGFIGSPSGPDPAAGVVNGALHFVSPGNRHLEVPNHPALNFGAGSFSIDAWINTNMGTQTEPIVDKLGNLSTGYALSIQGTSPANYRLTLVIGKSAGPVEVLQGPVILANSWNFVAATVSPPTVTFYVGNSNGFFQSTATINGTSNATNTRPLLIGGNPVNLHWNILIDELELFNKALSLTEVDAIWRAGSLGKCEIDDCLCGDLSTEAGAGFSLAVIDTAALIYAFQPLELMDDCDQITWNWGDGTATVQSMGREVVVHHFSSSDMFEVCMNILRIDDSGETCEHTTCSSVTSTNELEETKPFRLYPNPTSGGLTLKFKGATPKAGAIHILDLWGRVVQRETLTPGLQEHSFSLENLPPSVYFVEVLDDGVPIWVEKVIKQ